MKEGKIDFTSVFSAVIFLSVGVFIFLFVNAQQHRYDYFIYLYGAEVAPGSKALLKVISRDGEFVTNPEIFINGRKSATSLIDIRPDLREISVVIGGREVKFPVRYSDLENIRVPVPARIHISAKELENIPFPAVSGTKTVFLLPDQFRAVPEFETKIHFYCVDGDGPCKENEILINGTAKELKDGYLSFTTIFTHDKNVNISFSDGSSAVAKVPYSGKMLRFYADNSGIMLASLSDVGNVHIDCYSAKKWVGTDIVAIHNTGTRLPDGYVNCETVQASFNSSSPGTTYVVFSRSPELKGEVDDPYYSGLMQFIQKFPLQAQESFIRSYNSSFFMPLPLIFSGEVLEKEFNEKKSGELNFYWWMILISSLAGLILFIRTVFRKMKVVEGIDGELISRSMNIQRLMLAGAAVLYAGVIFLLLYLLKNLA
jgi:hypothetical protein